MCFVEANREHSSGFETVDVRFLGIAPLVSRDRDITERDAIGTDILR